MNKYEAYVLMTDVVKFAEDNPTYPISDKFPLSLLLKLFASINEVDECVVMIQAESLKDESAFLNNGKADYAWVYNTVLESWRHQGACVDPITVMWNLKGSKHQDLHPEYYLSLYDELF